MTQSSPAKVRSIRNVIGLDSVLFVLLLHFIAVGDGFFFSSVANLVVVVSEFGTVTHELRHLSCTESEWLPVAFHFN